MDSSYCDKLLESSRLSVGDVTEATSANSDEDTEHQKLPDELSVLFVDDDLVLRKLFTRSLRKVAPGWKVREAATGETALQLVDSETFDLIFMDMYMASVEKRLLGTETVVALRAKGIRSRIVGLSANNVEDQFFQAGADSFLSNPFPCDSATLNQELIRVLFHDRMTDV